MLYPIHYNNKGENQTQKKKVFLKVAKDTSAQNMAFKQITSILSAKNENWKTEEQYFQCDNRSFSI